MTQNQDWYYAEGDETKGPVNFAELKEKLAGKKIARDALVWTEGMDDWAPANSRAEFQFTAPPPKGFPKAAATTPAPQEEKPPAQPAPAPARADEEDADEEEELEDFDNLLHAVKEVKIDPEDAKKFKIVAVIGYFWVLFIIPLLFARKSKFARFHANQSLILFILGTFWWMVIVMLQFFVQLGFNNDLVGYLVTAMFVVPFIFSILGMVNAAKGRAKRLPVIGSMTILKV